VSVQKMSNVFWPSVGTVEGAEGAAKAGFVAAILVALITAAFATWAFYSNGPVAGFVDPWAYLDAVLFGAIAFGIYKESRAAAVFGLLLYLVEKGCQVVLTGQFQGAVMTFLFVLFFVSGVRGTFALHRLRRVQAGA
jgi:hypothetical protein